MCFSLRQLQRTPLRRRNRSILSVQQGTVEWANPAQPVALTKSGSPPKSVMVGSKGSQTPLTRRRPGCCQSAPSLADFEEHKAISTPCHRILPELSAALQCCRLLSRIQPILLSSTLSAQLVRPAVLRTVFAKPAPSSFCIRCLHAHCTTACEHPRLLHHGANRARVEAMAPTTWARTVECLGLSERR